MAELEHPNYYLCNALDPFAHPLRENGNEHVLGRGGGMSQTQVVTLYQSPSTPG
jgi:hypothetical protein